MWVQVVLVLLPLLSKGVTFFAVELNIDNFFGIFLATHRQLWSCSQLLVEVGRCVICFCYCMYPPLYSTQCSCTTIIFIHVKLCKR